jgi:glycosyltransferase involved in cell wall biosynthesis
MKKTLETISVIIPTYNRLTILKKVLPSYVNQDCVKEIVIVDDCSSDGTGNFLKKLAKQEVKIKYLRNSLNKGAPYSRNKAISKTSGNYVFIGEDDLELTDNYFETLLDHMHREEADIIAGRRIWMQKDETKQDSLLRADRIRTEVFNRNLLITNCEIKLDKDSEFPLVDASMLISRRVIEDVLYDEHYRKNSWREETDFQLSARIRGYKIIYCPHTISFHLYKNRNFGGNHAHSLFNYELEIFKNNLYMTRKHWLFLKKEFGINYWFYFRFVYYRLCRLILSRLHDFHEKVVYDEPITG